ncbi:MAG: hydroxylamine oxidoreductase, partial [Magnetococcales bacterium]|nr:hydroxylamine oxidoreductase [Magnetococcales bacterium]
ADKAVWRFGIREVNPRTAENLIKRKRWREVCIDCHPAPLIEESFTALDQERRQSWQRLYGIEAQLKKLRSDDLIRPNARERPPYPFDWMAKIFPRERIGFYEGQASAFYNVSALERDYFELWYFDNLAAYKGMAHQAPRFAESHHGRMLEAAGRIESQIQAIRAMGKVDLELAPLWLNGAYTRFNRDQN